MSLLNHDSSIKVASDLLSTLNLKFKSKIHDALPSKKIILTFFLQSVILWFFSCPRKYKGETCAEVKAHACDGVVCHNGGTCVAVNNSTMTYKCTCTEFYKGMNEFSLITLSRQVYLQISAPEACLGAGCLSRKIRINADAYCTIVYDGRHWNY